jgi:hypothetical protein
MCTRGNPRFRHRIETNRAFFVVLNRLENQRLQLGLELGCDLHGAVAGRVDIILRPKLIQVTSWDQPRMKSNLTQTGEHAQDVSSYLDIYELRNGKIKVTPTTWFTPPTSFIRFSTRWRETSSTAS